MIGDGSRYIDRCLASEDASIDIAPLAVPIVTVHASDPYDVAPTLTATAAGLESPPEADPSEAASGDRLDRLPVNVLNDISTHLRWGALVRLTRCSSQMHQRQGMWVRYRMQCAVDAQTIVDALVGILTLPPVLRPAAMRDVSVRMLTAKGSGDEAVLTSWREWLDSGKIWLRDKEAQVRFAGEADLLIAAYRVVSPKDRIKPGWIVRRILQGMLRLPVAYWPPALAVICDTGAHVDDLAYCIDKFVRRFRGNLHDISDPLATRLAHALLFQVSTYDVPATLRHRFGVTKAQLGRIVVDIARVIGETAATVTIAEYGEGTLDDRCARWRGDDTLQRLAEERFIAAVGPDIRLDKSWRMILLRGGATSARVHVIAQNRILAIESHTMRALADNPAACEQFLLQREAIGNVIHLDQWRHAHSLLDTLPWQARPALMLRLASRIAPPGVCALFDDEAGLTLLADVGMWTARIVPRCLKEGQAGLAARALASTLSVCSTFDGIDPSLSREIAAEVFACGLALLPPPEWGTLLDALCFAGRRRMLGSMPANQRAVLHSAIRTFLCDPHAHFVSPTPRFARWLCREAPYCWEALPDGGAPHRRWAAFCDRFDLSRDMRGALRLRVIAYYARGLASKPETIADVLARAGFNDAQGLRDLEDALWRLQGYWSTMPIEMRLARFGLTPGLRERIEEPVAEFGPETYRILTAVTR